MLQSRFPKLLLPSLPSWFTLTLGTLSSLSPLYSTYYLSSAPDAPEPPSPTSDAGFMPPKNNLDDLACAAFDFMIPTSRMKEVKGLLVRPADGMGTAAGGGAGGGKGRKGEDGLEGTDVLRELMRVVLEYTKITRANVGLYLALRISALGRGSIDESRVYARRESGAGHVRCRRQSLIENKLTRTGRRVARRCQCIRHGRGRRSGAVQRPHSRH